MNTATTNQGIEHPEIELTDVDIIFGDKQEEPLRLLDQGATREEILEKTDAVVGVCGASIKVRCGEICVLMGLSGSGKSTLLRAVNGLNQVSRGQVLLNHKGEQVDLAKVQANKMREIRMYRISMVFQQFALMPWRTVSENVGFGLELRGMSPKDRKSVIDEKLEMVGLTQWRDKYAHELSGGMQQRVGLARAFATDADILLMDEPFSALDPLIRARLQDELLELQSTINKTVLFVSHDLDEALKLGNSIVIMESGTIVQSGTPEDIVLNPVNEYVSDFVAHMNPVDVLKAKSIMSPILNFQTAPNEYFLNESRLIVKSSSDGRQIQVSLNGNTLPVILWKPGDSIQREQVHYTSIEISMKQAMEICHASKCPVLLSDAEANLVGVVDNDEVFKAILHRREPVISNQAKSPL